jgi:hypothetical protein
MMDADGSTGGVKAPRFTLSRHFCNKVVLRGFVDVFFGIVYDGLRIVNFILRKRFADQIIIDATSRKFNTQELPTVALVVPPEML